MSWIKKALIEKQAACSGVFSLQDFADFTLISTTNYRLLDQPDMTELKTEAWDTLYCPVHDLVTECKKAIFDHLKKIALNKQNRYFGDVGKIRTLKQNTPSEELGKLLEYSTRSSRHSVEALKQELLRSGISWEEAEEALAMAGMYNPALKDMDYYVKEYEGQQRFTDYNWKLLNDKINTLEKELNTQGRISNLITAMDFAINAVHNTTIEPQSFLFNQVSENIGLVREDAPEIPKTNVQRSLSSGESVLVYMQQGEEILPFLNAKRDAKTSEQAFEDLKEMASFKAQKVAGQLNRYSRIGLF